MKNYTVLHAHSEYSLLDGLSKCEDMAERYKEIGATAGVISDHGSVSGAIDFSKEMKDAGLKPILGCEFYISSGPATERTKENRPLSHQVILAKNKQGWRDLLQLVSTSNHKDHFYYKPRIDLDILGEIASRGNLISFSGHLGSTLANVITDDDKICSNYKNKGIVLAKRLQEMFGKDNFFLEVQLIDSNVNKFAGTVGGVVRELSTLTGIPCVATPDAHYCRQENAIDQQVLVCTSFKTTFGQANLDLKQGTASKTLQTFFRSNNYHIPSYEDMKEFHTDKELDNTNLVSSMCEDYNILQSPQMPAFDCPNNISPEDYLRKLCREGWSQKMGHITKEHEQFQEYGNRVNEELDIFTSTGLSSYFLIVKDILDNVRKRGYIIGPGRGSAAGCMVSYLLGITQIDPIPYNLVFSRFYNAGRNTAEKVSLPDIDFDVPKEARDGTIEDIRTKYGEENVAQIITFQTLKGRAALTRVMSAHGTLSFEEQKAITKCLPEEAKVVDELKGIEEEYGYSSSILWALEHNADEFKKLGCSLNSDGELEGPLADMFQQAIRIEGTKIISGKHAAGVVISNQPISESCPMVMDKDGKHMLAGFEGPSCEEVGLLKLDCLGIRALDKIMDVVDIVGGNDA